MVRRDVVFAQVRRFAKFQRDARARQQSVSP